MEKTRRKDSRKGNRTQNSVGASRSVKSIRKLVAGNWQYYLMLLPCVAALVVFCYLPYGGLILAFKEYSIRLGIWFSPFNGFDNFRAIFADPYFMKVTWNTVWLFLLNLVIGYPLPIIVTLFMNEMLSEKFKKLTQTVIYIPYFISWAVLAGILSTLFSDSGTITQLLRFVFGNDISFYVDGHLFVVLLIMSNLWKNTGWNTIIFFAAVGNISPELYDAAKIDGAGRFKCMWHVTLPGMSSAITITLILSLGGLLSGNFDQIVNMYNQLVYDKADIIQTYIYRIGIFDYKYGLSTALGLLQSVISLLIIVGANFIAKRITGEGIW